MKKIYSVALSKEPMHFTLNTSPLHTHTGGGAPCVATAALTQTRWPISIDWPLPPPVDIQPYAYEAMPIKSLAQEQDLNSVSRCGLPHAPCSRVCPAGGLQTRRPP